VPASRCVDAVVGQAQALDRSAVRQVGLGNFLRVGGRYKAIPDLFGVNDHRDPVPALIETPRSVDADAPGKTEAGGGRPQRLSNRLRVPGMAAAAGMAVGANVRANEDVSFKQRHRQVPRNDRRAAYRAGGRADTPGAVVRYAGVWP